MTVEDEKLDIATIYDLYRVSNIQIMVRYSHRPSLAVNLGYFGIINLTLTLNQMQIEMFNMLTDLTTQVKATYKGRCGIVIYSMLS